MVLALAARAPITITDERTVGATWAGPTGWRLAVWVALAAAFTVAGVYLLYRWMNARRQR